MKSTNNMYDDIRKGSSNGNEALRESSGAEVGDLIFHTRFVCLFEQGSCRAQYLAQIGDLIVMTRE